MAIACYQITQQNASYVVGGKSDPITAANTSLTDITAALAVTAIAGDPTSVTAVTLVQTDVTALKALINADCVVILNDATLTTQAKVFAALDALKQALRGSNRFS